MSVGLDGMARDLYDQLTAATFFAVDTEFSTHDDEHHLISIAVVPVIGGRRTKASHELYRVMNPGVPIDDVSSAIHGFTDASVTGKRSFGFYAATICERLREDNAVFVCHNPIDAHVLRRELVRLDEQTATAPPGQAPVGLAALPDLPIIDTQRLAVAVGYPGVGRNHQLSLDQLCDLTGVRRTAPAHDARNDARDTADAFIRLVRYAAEHTVFWTADDLLAAGAAGTLHAPAGASHLGPKHRTRTPLPADHIARHTTPLIHPVTADSDEAHAWLVLAGECATLRCPYLADEAAVTAPFNAHALLRPLMEDLPHLAEPGQAATLLAAVHAFLTAEPADGVPPVIVQAGLLKWWRVARDVIAATPPCDRRDPNTCCPACAEGEPCPRDTVGVPLAERVALGERGVMDEARVRELASPAVKGSINTWRKHHRDVLGYALWRAATYLLAQERDEDAFALVDRGIALGVHLVEPRLGHLACQRLLENGDPTGALAAASTLLGRKTSDSAYDDVADWAAFTHNVLYAQAPPAPRVISHPRRARPAGLTHQRRYT